MSLPIKKRLKEIGLAFLYGYHASYKHSQSNIEEQIDIISDELKGFSFEGAGMGFAFMDICSNSSHFQKFISKEAKKHIYMTYIGSGWALAKLKFVNYKNFMNKLDPILKWLVLDGYGFYEGYFNTVRSIINHRIPQKFVDKYDAHAYMQGIGRSIWFYCGGDLYSINIVIQGFDEKFQGDLWSGIGLASAYANGIPIDKYSYLKDLSGNYYPELCQGVAFACEARRLAELPMDKTNHIAMEVAGLNAHDMASITLLEKRDLPSEDNSYEQWRRNIQKHFNGGKVKNEISK
ncbi:DUF1702 family protein [Bacillus paralicheniformis]|nr:DUF1702 family protein [Bacillus paralicheniformis]